MRKINKGTVVKVMSMGLAVAIAAGSVLTYNVKSNANEVQNVAVERTVTMNAQEYVNANIDNLVDMSEEELEATFGNEEFQNEIFAAAKRTNKRGGGISLQGKLNKLSSSQLQNLAGKLADKLPKSMKEKVEENSNQTIEEIIVEILEKLKAGLDPAALSGWLQDPIGLNKIVADMLAAGIVGVASASIDALIELVSGESVEE